MRTLIALTLFAVMGQNLQAPTLMPKVEHHEEKQTHTETYDRVTRACPSGYEGHYVDMQKGFDWQDGYMARSDSIVAWPGGAVRESFFTVCLSTKFMDDIRKSSDMTAERPAPARPM